MENLVLINKQNMAHPVDASQLYEYLEIKHRFRAWINNRIEDYGFIENQDYEIIEQSNDNASGGRPTKVYAISLDMAKELAMLEKTEKGKTIRRYFIEVEKQARTIAQPNDETRMIAQKLESLESELHEMLNIPDVSRFIAKRKELSTLRTLHRKSQMAMLPPKISGSETYSLTNYLEPAQKTDTDAQFMTATQISEYLNRHFGLGILPVSVGKELKAAGFSESKDGKYFPEFKESRHGYYVRLKK